MPRQSDRPSPDQPGEDRQEGGPSAGEWVALPSATYAAVLKSAPSRARGIRGASGRSTYGAATVGMNDVGLLAEAAVLAYLSAGGVVASSVADSPEAMRSGWGDLAVWPPGHDPSAAPTGG